MVSPRREHRGRDGASRAYSPFYKWTGHDPLRNGIDVPSVLVALETCVVLVVLAALGFRRRDTAA